MQNSKDPIELMAYAVSEVAKENQKLKEEIKSSFNYTTTSWTAQKEEAFTIAVIALGKIADPRKRDHKEPDAYTQLGCVMNIAEEALDKINKLI